jgi:hypothetical protein
MKRNLDEQGFPTRQGLYNVTTLYGRDHPQSHQIQVYRNSRRELCFWNPDSRAGHEMNWGGHVPVSTLSMKFEWIRNLRADDPILDPEEED